MVSIPTRIRQTSRAQRRIPPLNGIPHHCQVAFHTIVRAGALVTCIFRYSVRLQASICPPPPLPLQPHTSSIQCHEYGGHNVYAHLLYNQGGGTSEQKGSLQSKKEILSSWHCAGQMKQKGDDKVTRQGWRTHRARWPNVRAAPVLPIVFQRPPDGGGIAAVAPCDNISFACYGLRASAA